MDVKINERYMSVIDNGNKSDSNNGYNPIDNKYIINKDWSIST